MENICSRPFRKSKITLILFFLVLKFQVQAQTYLTNTTSTPKTYNTCGGMYYDNGGASGDYTVSVNNRVTTFCSNNGNAIKIDFTQFNVEFSYDKLYIYDGPNTSSPQIVLLSGNISPGSFISTGTCLTFKFYSDGWFPYPGWEAIITCVPKPPCASNPVANNLCSAATFIANLNGYCGNTSSSYSPDTSPDLLHDFCGSIENNSWLRFTASATTASFNVWTSNCSVGDGIQIQIYSTSDCLNFNPVSNCWNNLFDANSTVTATGLTIGQDYYMMIDGTDGDVCDYLIGGQSGIITLPNDNFTLELTCNAGNANLNWSLDENDKLKFFRVEKSLDGINFHTISELNNENSNSSRINYNFEDVTSYNTSAYYRIKFFDLDGKQSTSEIVFFECDDVDFECFPNPSSNFLTIKSNTENKTDKKLKILDALGQIVLLKTYSDVKINEVIDISFLSTGIYTVLFENQGNIISKKFTKIN